MRPPARLGFVGSLFLTVGVLAHGCATGETLGEDDGDGGMGRTDAAVEAGGSSGAIGASSGAAGSSSGATSSSGASSASSGGSGGASSSSGSSSGNGSSSSSSASSSSSGGVPTAWRCAPFDYDDGFDCDCGCGVRDPDCFSSSASACDTCDEFNCNAFSFAECIDKLQIGNNGVCGF